MRLHKPLFALLTAGFVYCGFSSAADPVTASPPVSEIGAAEIAEAIDKLKADPNLATEKKTRTLRWKSKEEKEKPKKEGDLPESLKWIGEFFSWVGESARILVWILAALLAAFLVVQILRFARGYDRKLGHANTLFTPTHVRDLDIRPESLPDDIGKAALELWEQGEHRASLSLLYRGLLSRLAHKYAAPIKHSSTEGECLLLALQHMPAGCHDYASALVRTWQGAVYGGVEPQMETVRYLCAHFALTLDKTHSASAPATSASSSA